MSSVDSLPTASKIFSKQLVTELKQLNYIPLDAELEPYYESMVGTFKLLGRDPDWVESQHMRITTLAYLGTDLINSSEYLALHEFTRSWQDEFASRLNFKLPPDTTTVTDLKTDGDISVVKAPYNETATTENMETVTLGSYSAYMVVDNSGNREVILARLLMAPQTFALENIIVGDFKDAYVSNDPRSRLLLDAELIPRLLGGPMGYNGIRITSDLSNDGLYVMANCVSFAYKNGGAVYVFQECSPDNTVYYIFDTLDDYNCGIGNYYSVNIELAQWSILIAYERLPASANVQPAEYNSTPVQEAEDSDADGDSADEDDDNDQHVVDAQLPNTIKNNENIDIEVTKFLVRKRDRDGDMRTDIEIGVRNTTQFKVRLIRTNTIFLTKDGVIIGGNNDNYEYENLAPGEVAIFEPGNPYIKANLGAKPWNTLIRVFTTLYSRELHKLGEGTIPESNKSYTLIRKTVNSNTIAPEVTATILYNCDEDGRVSVEVRCGLTNITNQHLDKVVLKTYLLDSEDEEIENSTTTIQLPPQSGVCIEDSFWRVNKNRVRGAKCRFFLAVYTPIALKTCQAPSKLAERD